MLRHKWDVDKQFLITLKLSDIHYRASLSVKSVSFALCTLTITTVEE